MGNRNDHRKMPAAAIERPSTAAVNPYRMAAYVKGLGCRLHEGRGRVFSGRRPKPSSKELPSPQACILKGHQNKNKDNLSPRCQNARPKWGSSVWRKAARHGFANRPE